MNGEFGTCHILELSPSLLSYLILYVDKKTRHLLSMPRVIHIITIARTHMNLLVWCNIYLVMTF